MNFLSALAALALAAAPLPGDSVHRLDAPLTNQAGSATTLADHRGQVVVVAMFYTSCRYVCPLIVDSAKGVEHALSESERANVDFILVSLDPARDDVAALKSVADKRKLALPRWSLVRAEAANVRKLAAVLGVRYRALADGEFNHESSMVLLDREGRRIATATALGSVPDPAFVAKVRAAIAAP